MNILSFNVKQAWLVGLNGYSKKFCEEPVLLELAALKTPSDATNLPGDMLEFPADKEAGCGSNSAMNFDSASFKSSGLCNFLKAL